MSYAFVVDTNKRPLDPIHPGQARRLLKAGKAAVLRRSPFVVILKTAHPEAQPHPVRLKLDPGSRTTGIAVVNDESQRVVWAAHLIHRGEQVLTWVNRLLRFCPIGAISLELVKFDSQLLQHAEIRGIAYQQGELAGWEVRQYVLAKWNYRCAYCGKQNVPFELDHIVPRSRHGSDRVSNLALACHDCNQAKGERTAEEFGHPEVQVQARTSLRDAAAVNTTRWALYGQLKLIGLPLETGSGGLTKWNRTKRGLPKTHWVDAANVGKSTPATLHIAHIIPWHLKAIGRQRRQMCLIDKHGFPRSKAKHRRAIHGFQTGDIVEAVVPKGKRAGRYQGKVAVKASGYFSIATKSGTVTDIAHRYCRLVHRSDGYSY